MRVSTLYALVLQVLLATSLIAAEPISVSVRLFEWPGEKTLPTDLAEILKLAKEDSGPSAEKTIHSGEETVFEFPEAPNAKPPKRGTIVKILPIVKEAIISVQLSVQIFETIGYVGSHPITRYGTLPSPVQVTPQKPDKFMSRKQPVLFFTAHLNEPMVVFVLSEPGHSKKEDGQRSAIDQLLFPISPIERYAIVEFSKAQ